MRFLLSQREKNTEILCSECEHLVDGECKYLVRIDGAFFRLARLSRSGGECQLFNQKLHNY